LPLQISVWRVDGAKTALARTTVLRYNKKNTQQQEDIMAWLEITLTTRGGTVDDVAAALTAGGFSDLLMEDQQEFEEFLEENRDYWDYIDEDLQQKLQGLSHIKLYLEDTDTAGMTKLTALVEKLRQRSAFGALEMTTTALPDTDWEEGWKENYPPQEVGENLVVLPYWLADSYDGGRTPIILDPGLTFGTGAHASTQMVMEAMEKCIRPGFACLDLGSGSGILSLAALRLGAESAIGVDIDPKAEDIARENAAYNGFAAPAFTALTGNVTADEKMMTALSEKNYDLVLVNIVADVIIALAPILPAFLSQHTTLLLSGILDSRETDVRTALEQAGLTVVQTKAKEDWRSLKVRKGL
jgi:ribosomal protein L11 methyltransferase